MELIAVRRALFEQNTARAAFAQGDPAGALKICPAVAMSLDYSGGDKFIEYELPWLMESGQIEAAGHRALLDIYEQEGQLWPGTALLVHTSLLSKSCVGET